MENFLNSIWPYAFMIAFSILEGWALGYIFAIWARFYKWLYAFVFLMAQVIVIVVLHSIWEANLYILFTLGILSLAVLSALAFKSIIDELKSFRPWKY